MKLQERYHEWGLAGEKRGYVVITIPFGLARTLFVPELYSARTGKGEQRSINPAHARRIKRAMLDGRFTPTVWHVGTRPRHRNTIQFHDESVSGSPETRVRYATLEVEPGGTLPLLNAGHRRYSLEDIREAANKKGDRELLALVDSQPVTAMVLLNGKCQEDFLNLQIGKSVDGSHMLSLQLQTKQLPQKHMAPMKLANDICRLLYDCHKSPFYKQIRFDSQSSAPLLLKSICSTGPADIGTSLVGLAKVLLDFGHDAKYGANLITTVYGSMLERSPTLVQDADAAGNPVRKLLTPPPEGRKGSAGMLVGVCTLFAYRMQLLGRKKPEEADLDALVAAAEDTLDSPVNGDLSAQTKRQFMGHFAQRLFADLEVEKKDGIPSDLMELLSASTFGVGKKKAIVDETTEEPPAAFVEAEQELAPV